MRTGIMSEEVRIQQIAYHVILIVTLIFFFFEGLYTLFTPVEVVLHYRPLIPPSKDPKDPTFLTSGHPGEFLTDMTKSNITALMLNRLPRW